MFPVETISAKMLDYYVGRFDTVIIDLRNEKEYAAGHVRTAYNIPYEVFAEEPGMLEKKLPATTDKILVFYCERGGASLWAARMAAARGFRTKSVIGGFMAYRGRNLVISGKA